MTAQTRLLRAAKAARHEITMWLGACSPKEIRDSFMGFANAEKQLIGAIARYQREKKKGLI